MITEHWLPIAEWEDLYAVSDWGNVLSFHAITPRLLKPQANSSGHLEVTLCDAPRRVPRQVHHLVLEQFVGLCPDGMEGCHRNDDPTDNALGNLRWDTRSANMIDRVANGLHHNANKTVCHAGHEFTPENTYIQRICRTCNRDKMRKRRAA